MVAVVYYDPSSYIAWWVEHADAGIASITVFVSESERLLKLLENHTSTALEKLSYVMNSFKLLGHRQSRVPFRTANPRYAILYMPLCLYA